MAEGGRGSMCLPVFLGGRGWPEVTGARSEKKMAGLSCIIGKCVMPRVTVGQEGWGQGGGGKNTEVQGEVQRGW